MLKDFVNLIFPETCVGCSEVLPTVFKHLCPVCNQMLPVLDITDTGTFLKLAGRVRIDSCYSYIKFNKTGLAQRILHELKYKSNPDLGFYIGERFAKFLLKENVQPPVNGLIPVPVHSKRLKERGYNQAEIIARGMASVFNIEVRNDILVRHKEGASQTRKGRAARLENMAECFSLNEGQNLQNMQFGLVDDVITTGATLEACCLSLEKAKAAAVTIFSIANA